MSSVNRRRVKTRIPTAVREQFFSIFTKPEPETIYPDLYSQIIDDGTDIILENVKRYNEERKRLVREIRSKLSIKQAKHNEDLANNALLVASDAGNNGVDLRSAFAPLYAAVAIITKGWKILDDPISKAGRPDLWSREYKTEERESMLAMKTQFDVTLKAVEKWKPQFVVSDGLLLLHWGLLPGKDATDEYWQDFKDTAVSVMKLLQHCYEHNITIVGFIKRTRMSKLGEQFEDFHPKAGTIRDTALLDLILRQGQYTVLEVEAPRGGVVNQYRAAGKSMSLSKEEIDRLTTFHSAYIRTGLTTPYRLEMPEYCLGKLDEIASILCTTSEEDGIPFAINEADRMTKMTNIISNIRSLMLFSKALDLVKKGEMDSEDLNLLALQHGESWTLREEKYFQDVQQLQEGG